MRPPTGIQAPVAVLEIDLGDPVTDQHGLGRYDHVLLILRLHRVPMGAVYAPVEGDRLPAAAIEAAVRGDRPLMARLARASLEDWLAGPAPDPELTTWSIIICTRDRPDDLRRCLASIAAADQPPGGEVIVVDNAPSDDATARVAAEFPVRYAREDRAGLNWARSRGTRLASGEVLLFTDDDVVVDRDWIRGLLEPFSAARVAAATGLTLPLELETEAQVLFERYGGFSRGFERREYDLTVIRPASAGQVGAGANMALRRSVARDLELFDAELDCGTVARTGGDTYAFYRLLAAGYRIVYTPRAMNRHRHRRDLPSLRRTLRDYSVGGFSVLLRFWVDHRDWDAPRVAVSWVIKDHLARLVEPLVRSEHRLPWPLVAAYLRGVPEAPFAYLAARRRERKYGRAPFGRLEEAA